MRDDKDRSSKWLIEHHGGSILRPGGVSGFRAWRAAQAEVVQPRQLPDGLLEAFFGDRAEPDPFMVEIATYPEARVREQAVRDALLVFLARHVLPEVLTLVLHPKGQFRLTGQKWGQPKMGPFEVLFRVIPEYPMPFPYSRMSPFLRNLRSHSCCCCMISG